MREQKLTRKISPDPWLNLVWLLAGPVPLFLVMAWQAHQLRVHQPTPNRGKPAVLLLAAPAPIPPTRQETSVKPLTSAKDSSREQRRKTGNSNLR